MRRAEMRTEGRTIVPLLGTLLLLLTLSACSVNEAEEDPMGGVHITATDTAQGLPLTEGQVILDGQVRANELPATINELDTGDVEILVRPDGGYPERTRTVTVQADQITEAHFLFDNPDNNPENNVLYRFTLNVDGAFPIVDDEFTVFSVIPGETSTIMLPPGEYALSAYKAGHKTVLPALYDATHAAGEEVDLTFELVEQVGGNDVGSLVYDFSKENDDGTEMAIGQFRGRVVLINFWFFACVPCREEFPDIQQVYEDRVNDGFRILAINTGLTGDRLERFQEIRELFELTFPLLQNPEGPDFTIDLFEAFQSPTNILVDKTGMIRYRFGATTYDDLIEKVDILLAE